MQIKLQSNSKQPEHNSISILYKWKSLFIKNKAGINNLGFIM